MGIVALLYPLASLGAFVAFIWLVVVAFKRSPLWGIGVLLLSPISATIFAIKYWAEAKKPFLIYAASMALSFFCFLYTFSAVGGFEVLSAANSIRSGEFSEEDATEFLNRMEDSGALSDEQQSELQRMREQLEQDPAGGSSGGSPEVERSTVAHSATPRRTIPPPRTRGSSGAAYPLLGSPAIPAAPPSSATSPYKSVPLSQAGDHVGKVVRVVETDGSNYRGTLTRADADTLRVERYLSSGTVALDLPKRDVQKLLVLFR